MVLRCFPWPVPLFKQETQAVHLALSRKVTDKQQAYIFLMAIKLTSQNSVRAAKTPHNLSALARKPPHILQGGWKQNNIVQQANCWVGKKIDNW